MLQALALKVDLWAYSQESPIFFWLEIYEAGNVLGDMFFLMLIDIEYLYTTYMSYISRCIYIRIYIYILLVYDMYVYIYIYVSFLKLNSDSLTPEKWCSWKTRSVFFWGAKAQFSGAFAVSRISYIPKSWSRFFLQAVIEWQQSMFGV